MYKFSQERKKKVKHFCFFPLGRKCFGDIYSGEYSLLGGESLSFSLLSPGVGYCIWAHTEAKPRQLVTVRG